MKTFNTLIDVSRKHLVELLSEKYYMNVILSRFCLNVHK